MIGDRAGVPTRTGTDGHGRTRTGTDRHGQARTSTDRQGQADAADSFQNKSLCVPVLMRVRTSTSSVIK